MGCFGFIGGWIVGAIGDWPLGIVFSIPVRPMATPWGWLLCSVAVRVEGNSLSLAPAARDSTRPTRPPRGSLGSYRRDSAYGQ